MHTRMSDRKSPSSGSLGPTAQIGVHRANCTDRIGREPQSVKKVSAKGKAKVFVVDDHPLVRDFIRHLINLQPDLTVCGEAEQAAQAMRGIAESEADLAIVDLTLKDSHGIDLLKDLNLQFPYLPVLVLTMHDESIFAEHALRAGAKGYINKEEPAPKILAAIRKVLAGGIHLSDEASARIVQKSISARREGSVSPIDLLSDRELQILQLIGEGQTSQQIARILHLDARTVGTYRARIREKLNIEEPSQLLSYAVQWARAKGATVH
jgi:DNA-binding NarL/FixJ family response regulator